MKPLRSLAITFFIGLATAVHAEEPVWVWLTLPPGVAEQYRKYGEAEALADVAKGTLKVKGFGLPIPDEDVDHLYFKYRLQDGNLGCIIDERQKIYLEAYRKVMDKELERRYGKNFWQRFELELAALRAEPNKPLKYDAP